MMGIGLLLLCLLIGLRLIWVMLRHRGITLFVCLVGIVAIASYARATTPQDEIPPEITPKIDACNTSQPDLTACTAVIEGANGQDSDLAWAYNNRGIAHAARGDLLRAIADYSRAIELAPDHPAAWSNRGSAHAFLGDLLPALADHEQALELAPENASAWHNRGVDLEELGQHRKAISDYQRAIQLDPRHLGSHIGLATANCKLGRIKTSARARLALIDKGLMQAIQLQKILQDDGFYKGPLDGKFGKGSRAALRAWTRKGCRSHA